MCAPEEATCLAAANHMGTMDRLREWEVAEQAAVAAERLAANLDGVDDTLGAVRHARQKARMLRAKADDPVEKKLIHTVRGVGYVLEDRP